MVAMTEDQKACTIDALTHDQLAADLAAYLAGYSTPMAIWTDMQLGPSGSARPDVYTIEKTYTALRARAFEVKISRSDFLSDVTKGKYLRYLQYAGSVTFATPAGLISKEEVPKGCGLITRSPKGVWRFQKKPTMNATPPLPQDAWLKLVIDGCARERESARATNCGPRAYMEWQAQDRMRKKAGRELAMALANRDKAMRALTDESDVLVRRQRARIENEAEAAKSEMQKLQAALQEAAKAMGLQADTSWWKIRNELDERMKGSASEDRIREALRTLEWSRRHVGESAEQLRRLLPVAPGSKEEQA
ncbi:MAG: hypothetical protein LBL59_07285 [Xanthomonadaceae bacterium]|jgi:hypothetical protein|nr:hypothetical protein [Xanthomonadaceae bacterium]